MTTTGAGILARRLHRLRYPWTLSVEGQYRRSDDGLSLFSLGAEPALGSDSPSSLLVLLLPAFSCQSCLHGAGLLDRLVGQVVYVGQDESEITFLAGTIYGNGADANGG